MNDCGYKIGDRVHVTPVNGDEFDHEFDGTIIGIDLEPDDESFGFGPDFCVKEDGTEIEYCLLSDNLSPVETGRTKEDDEEWKRLTERGRRCTTQEEAHDIDIQLERLGSKKK